MQILATLYLCHPKITPPPPIKGRAWVAYGMQTGRPDLPGQRRLQGLISSPSWQTQWGHVWHPEKWWLSSVYLTGDVCSFVGGESESRAPSGVEDTDTGHRQPWWGVTSCTLINHSPCHRTDTCCISDPINPAPPHARGSLQIKHIPLLAAMNSDPRLALAFRSQCRYAGLASVCM